MKNILLITFAVVLLGVIGFLGYSFLSSTDEQEEQTPTQATSSEENVQEEIQDSSGADQTDGGTGGSADSDCPEGYVCMDSDTVATVPTITLGVDKVLAQEVEEEEDTEQEETPDDTEQEEDTDETPEEQEIVIADNTPQNVTVTNKDFRIWSIIWVTQKPQTGYVQYGTSASTISREIIDDRDTSKDSMEERFTHHVTITNVEADLNEEEVTFYFKIVSGGEIFDENGSPYTYENAPLTSSPSSPQSVAVTTDPITGYAADDFIVIAKQVSESGIESSSVSDAFTEAGGVELIIGITRNQNLDSYFPYTGTNTLETKVYGPNGYTSYVTGVSLSSVEDQVLTISTSQTGYEGDIYASSTGSGDFTIVSPDEGGTDTGQDQVDDLPETGIEDSLAFKSIFGFVLFLLGLCTVMLFIPWNYKRLWEERVIERIEDET